MHMGGEMDRHESHDERMAVRKRQFLSLHSNVSIRRNEGHHPML